jgi:hypothetical protein
LAKTRSATLRIIWIKNQNLLIIVIICKYWQFKSTYLAMQSQRPILSVSIEGSHKYSNISLKLGSGTDWTRRISNQYTESTYAHCGKGRALIIETNSTGLSRRKVSLFLNSCNSICKKKRVDSNSVLSQTL